MTTLVTGASGQLGRLVVDRLIARGADPASIVAGARKPDAIADLADRGVVTVHLDYADPESIGAAFVGVDQVLLISGSELGQRVAQHTSVIQAAAAAGVAKLLYTSAPHADTTELVLAPEHKATEEAIAASGVPAVILRNNWYSEMRADDVVRARESGVIAGSAGDGRTASASRLDYADAAAVVLLEDGHLGQVYELAGDVAWTPDELAATVAEIVGRPVVYQHLTAAEQTAALTAAGVPEAYVALAVGIDAAVARGDLAETDGTLARLIGRPTTPLADTLRTVS